MLAARRKARRPYSRTGLNALKARVKVRGLDAIDKRSAAARALLAWRGDLIADLGGEDSLSAQQRVIVDLAARTKLYVDSLDAWLMQQPSLVLNRRRQVLPVLIERQRLADSLAAHLGRLGLERKVKPLTSLSSYIAQTAQAKAEGPQPAT